MKRILLTMTWLLAAASVQAAKPLQVVCTLTDLGWLAQQVGGDDVRVQVLCPGQYDPHNKRYPISGNTVNKTPGNALKYLYFK